MGKRSSDRWALPLCGRCHREIEGAGSKNEIDWFRERGIDCLRLAAELWGAWKGETTFQAVQLALFKHRIEVEHDETDDSEGVLAAHPGTGGPVPAV